MYWGGNGCYYFWIVYWIVVLLVVGYVYDVVDFDGGIVLFLLGVD